MSRSFQAENGVKVLIERNMLTISETRYVGDKKDEQVIDMTAVLDCQTQHDIGVALQQSTDAAIVEAERKYRENEKEEKN